MKKILLGLSLISSILLADTNQTLSVNPFEEIEKMQKQMDIMFQQMQQKFFNDPMFKNMQTSIITQPNIDLLKKDNNYIIKADIPGSNKDAIKITTKDNILKIEANIQKQEKEQKKDFIKQERFVQQYLKIITLPQDADTSKLKTDYKNGVLTITIPKKK